ncbi:MAG TPA: LuxR C-terminal-related transcriptional regulator, partial [Candidatus Elarobacter sp.]
DCGVEREYPQLLGWLEAEASKRPNTVGFLHLYRARLARSGMDRERHARLAVSAFDEAGYRLWKASALEVAGDTAAAVAVYDECGAVRDVRRLSARGRGNAPRSTNSLTKRETQVSALAAQGLSNREIGDKLSLSDRTVEHHLSAVFAKLGVRSRVELAARRPERIS